MGPGDRVLLVDDVVTTGGSILRAYEEAAKTGAQVVAASALVDRGGRAAEQFADRGVAYLPVVTHQEPGAWTPSDLNPAPLAEPPAHPGAFCFRRGGGEDRGRRTQHPDPRRRW